MTYFLFSFVFMLMYGGFVAVLAYKAGKSSKRLIKALNLAGNSLYIDTAKIESVLIDRSAEDKSDTDVLVNFSSQSRFKCRLSDNPWIEGFIKGVGK